MRTGWGPEQGRFLARRAPEGWVLVEPAQGWYLALPDAAKFSSAPGNIAFLGIIINKRERNLVSLGKYYNEPVFVPRNMGSS